MAIRFRSQTTEKYYCPHCQSFRSFDDVGQNWQCPKCNVKVRIRLEIDDFVYACYRLTPDKLNVGEIVTLENEHLHEVLAITKNAHQYYIALKNYRAINFREDEIITQIDGGWYLD